MSPNLSSPTAPSLHVHVDSCVHKLRPRRSSVSKLGDRKPLGMMQVQQQILGKRSGEPYALFGMLIGRHAQSILVLVVWKRCYIQLPYGKWNTSAYSLLYHRHKIRSQSAIVPLIEPYRGTRTFSNSEERLYDVRLNGETCPYEPMKRDVGSNCGILRCDTVVLKSATRVHNESIRYESMLMLIIILHTSTFYRLRNPTVK